jgi:viroplasmin and RNaseH domain-containing protein
MNFSDFDAIVLKQDQKLHVIIENRTNKESTVKIEVDGNTNILTKTLKANEHLERILPFDNANEVIIYDDQGNKAVWE